MADELRAALELATEAELESLTEILFRRKFNPIDYLYTPDPIDVQSQAIEKFAPNRLQGAIAVSQNCGLEKLGQMFTLTYL